MQDASASALQAQPGVLHSDVVECLRSAEDAPDVFVDLQRATEQGKRLVIMPALPYPEVGHHLQDQRLALAVVVIAEEALR